MFITNIKVSFKFIRSILLENFCVFLSGVLCITMFITLFCVFMDNSYYDLNNPLKYSNKFVKISMDSSNIFRNANNFDYNDVRSLKRLLSCVEYVSPEVYFKANVGNKFNNLKCLILSVNEDYKDLLNVNIVSGRFITEYECINKSNVVVIDSNISLKLFGTANSVGKEIYIENDGRLGLYKVIGVMKPKYNMFKNRNLYEPNFCIIPFENSVYKFDIHSELDYIYVSVKKDINIKNIHNYIDNFLRVTRNNSSAVYEVDNIKINYRFENKLYDGVKNIILFLSIYILGFTIMHMMNLNVDSRAREICLKKNMGLKNFSIFIQFVIESVILTLIVVSVGVIFGVLCSFLMYLILGAEVYVSNVFIFFVIYCNIGIIFGILPCFKSCKINCESSIYE